MFPGQLGPTKFETLEESLKNATKSIAIPNNVIGFTPGSRHGLDAGGAERSERQTVFRELST